MDILQIVKDYGEVFYAITFAWTFVEGETFVIFAGLAARHDLLRLDLLIASAWLGSFCGDQLVFYVGRRWGTRLLRRYPRWRPGVESALAWLRAYDTWFILSFRFVYIVRNFASFAMGMSGLPWPRFLVLNFVAAGLWATAFAGGGYLAGAALEAVLGDIAHGVGLVMLIVFAAFVTLIARLHRAHRSTPALTPKSNPAPGDQ
jgi:membrane protein DedA with SNARE-associated domain